MKKESITRHPLVTGTILLTLAGLLSRIIGFFYRIFLSHTIGAQGLGIYQLIFPIYALTFSFTAAGIQTAISKFVAAAAAFGDTGSPDPGKGSRGCTYLYAGLGLSLALSALCSLGLYWYAEPMAALVLDEPRCAPLLEILALTVPFGAIHSCINGYYYGLQKTAVPAISQLLEQLARVGGVYFLYLLAREQNRPLSMEMAVWGLVLGEIASSMYCITVTKFRKMCGSLMTASKQIFTMALPLTANRVFLNLFQSAEAILIPGRLKAFGCSPQEALSIFGVLTGMAMPMILFPSVVTNSIAVMLLPAISEAQAKQDLSYIRNAVTKSVQYCITLGLLCTLGFLICGRWLGTIVFGDSMAGSFLVTLGWICPFLYLTTTLSSILNGLGRTTSTFLLNLSGSGVRIFFVLALVPILGIKAYLWGMLLSHLLIAGSALILLLHLLWRKTSPSS